MGFIPNSFIILNLEGENLDLACGRKLRKESWYLSLEQS